MANAENTKKGLMKVWNDALEQVTNRFKDVEKLWADTFQQINTRFQGAEKDARDFLKKVEVDGKKRMETVTTQLKDLQVEELVGRFKASELVEQGSKFGAQTADKLGIDLVKLNETVDKLTGRLETMTHRDTVSRSDFDALMARVVKLEKAAPKKATAKKAATKKAAPKKAAVKVEAKAKKPATKKTTKKATTKKAAA